MLGGSAMTTKFDFTVRYAFQMANICNNARIPWKAIAGAKPLWTAR